MKNILDFKNRNLIKPRKKIISAASLVIFSLVLLASINELWAEGSGTWTGTQTSRKTSLLISRPGTGGTDGYDTRGSMMLSSPKPGLDVSHRFYVYVKAGETVFWGFHKATSGSITATWYYDPASSSTNFFPTLLVGTSISTGFVSNSSVPTSQTDALNGPSQLTGSGYTAAYSFTNTGTDRAFWVEMDNSDVFEIDWWDVTVCSGSTGAYTEQTGRVYCKYWGISDLNNPFEITSGGTNSYSYHDNFTFFVPVENTNSAGLDYIVKSINFGGSNGGYANFFSNDDGPINSSTYDLNRRSKSGTSSNNQYPLFINDPDITIFPTSPAPTASQSVEFSSDGGGGGNAVFTVIIDNPSVVDILVDIDRDGTKDPEDVLLSEYFPTSGSHTITWDGKNGLGTEVANNTYIRFKTSFLFYPIHFPIYDMEQSLGITVQNIRPGTVYNELLYWDNTDLATSTLQSVKVNTTGLSSPNHIWYATGGNGFSDVNTVNSWTGSKVVILADNYYFNYDGADLGVTMSITPAVQVVGSNVTFVVTATNNGPNAATGVVVNDVLPAGYTLVSATPSVGSWTAPNWTIGGLAIDASATLTIVATVTSTNAYTNTASIDGTETDLVAGNNSASQTLGNNAPIAVNDVNTTFVSTAVSGNVLTNDYDPDGQTLTIGTTGTIATTHGSITIAGNGVYTYTPTTNYTGEDSYTYTVCDNGGPNKCDVATIKFNVIPLITGGNDAPIAMDDAYQGALNKTVSGQVLANDIDAEGVVLWVMAARADTDGDGAVDDALTLAVSTPIYGVNTSSAIEVAGALVLNSNGTFTFVPTVGFTGVVTYTYSATDGTLSDVATVTIEIKNSNTVNAVYALNDAIRTDVSIAVSGNVLTNDYDPEGNNIVVTAVSGYDTGDGLITILANGSFTFTPDAGFVGNNTYTYTITDNGSPVATDTGVLTITMEATATGVNDAPVALNDAFSGAVGTTVSGNVITNDYDVDGDALTATTVLADRDGGGVSNDAVTLSSATTIYGTNALGVTVVAGTLTITSAGAVTFVGATNFQGTATFTYSAYDGALSDQATVYIDVIGGNSIFAVSDAFIVEKDHTLSTGNVLTNDYDPQGNTLTVTAAVNYDTPNGTLTINTNGTFTYVPDASFVGTDSYVYTVTDNGTPQASDTATMYFIVYSSGLPCLISNNPTHSK